MIPIDDDKVQETIAYVILAAIAGFLASLSRSVDNGRPIKIKVTVLEAFTSGFVGFIALMMCRAMGLSLEWTGVIVGLLGWLGASASIKLIEAVARRRLGIADSNPFVAEYKGEERRDDNV